MEGKSTRLKKPRFNRDTFLSAEQAKAESMQAAASDFVKNDAYAAAKKFEEAK